MAAPWGWGDDEWKVKRFTKERPFLDMETTRKWLDRKQAYRELKSTGKV